MINSMYKCTMTCIVVLVLRSLMLSKNAITYSRCITLCILHWDITEYPDYKRCPDFMLSTLRGSIVPVFNSMYYTVLVPRVCTSVL